MSSIINSEPKRDYAFAPKQHFELGEALGMMDFETAAETVRRALRRAEERAGAAGARARPVHARSAHDRARLHRSQSAAAGARRCDVRHGAVAEVSRTISSRIRARRISTLTARRLKQLIARFDDRRDAISAVDIEAHNAARIHRSKSILAHPHRRSAADQSRARVHHRRSANCRCGSPPTRRASAPRRAPRDATRAA